MSIKQVFLHKKNLLIKNWDIAFPFGWNDMFQYTFYLNGNVTSTMHLCFKILNIYSSSSSKVSFFPSVSRCKLWGIKRESTNNYVHTYFCTSEFPGKYPGTKEENPESGLTLTYSHQSAVILWLQGPCFVQYYNYSIHSEYSFKGEVWKFGHGA